MNETVLTAMRDHLAQVITKLEATLAEHKGALATLDTELARIPGVADLKALLAKLSV